MKTEKKELNKNQIELTIRVSKSEAQTHLTKAATKLSEQRQIKGFRPGKAPYEIVKKEFGEPAILNEALEDIINDMVGQVLETEQINPYGQIGFDLLPTIDLNDAVSFKALVTLMPTVKLGDWQKKKIKREVVKVTDEDLNKAIDEMAAMLTREEPTDKPAQMNDKTAIDFEVFVDGKLIEGGKANDFELILGEGKMIPGFEEKIVGAKAGDKVEFTLNFPTDYHAEQLAGKPAEFKINVKQIFSRVKPIVDEEMAKRVGVADLTELKVKLSENILKEKQEREEERVEIAAIKQITETAIFSDLPPAMIGETAHELVHDFEHTLAHQGMPFDKYLQSINKKEADLIKDFEPKAIERIKSSMALGQLAENEKLTLTNEEVDAELEAQKLSYAGNQKALNDLQNPEYRRHVANSIINRKIINFLKEKLVE